MNAMEKHKTNIAPTTLVTKEVQKHCLSIHFTEEV